MELRHIKVGRRYKVKQKGKLVTGILEGKHPTDKGQNPTIQYNFLDERRGRRFSVRGAALIIEEVPKPIGAGDLVKLIKGVDINDLNRIYKVVRTEGDRVFLPLATGRELEVSISSLRHVEDVDPPRCFYVNCERGVTFQFEGKPCCTTHFRFLTGANDASDDS